MVPYVYLIKLTFHAILLRAPLMCGQALGRVRGTDVLDWLNWHPQRPGSVIKHCLRGGRPGVVAETSRIVNVNANVNRGMSEQHSTCDITQKSTLPLKGLMHCLLLRLQRDYTVSLWRGLLAAVSMVLSQRGSPVRCPCYTTHQSWFKVTLKRQHDIRV